jgi:hypothetical protein
MINICKEERARHKNTDTKRINWKLADAIKSKIMRITSPEMNYDHSGKNAFFPIF